MRGSGAFSVATGPGRMRVAPQGDLPPLSAYQVFVESIIGNNAHKRGQHKALDAQGYRRLAAMRRAGTSCEEQGAAIGMSASNVSRFYRKLPPELR